MHVIIKREKVTFLFDLISNSNNFILVSSQIITEFTQNSKNLWGISGVAPQCK